MVVKIQNQTETWCHPTFPALLCAELCRPPALLWTIFPNPEPCRSFLWWCWMNGAGHSSYRFISDFAKSGRLWLFSIKYCLKHDLGGCFKTLDFKKRELYKEWVYKEWIFQPSIAAAHRATPNSSFMNDDMDAALMLMDICKLRALAAARVWPPRIPGRTHPGVAHWGCSALSLGDMAHRWNDHIGLQRKIFNPEMSMEYRNDG